MEPAKRNIVLFDFDGVIADTFEAAFRVAGSFEPSLTRENVRERFEGNINDYHEKENGKPVREAGVSVFFRMYAPEVMRSRIFPGIRDAIDALSAEFTLMVVSSTISAPIREYLALHHAAHYFSEIMGSDVHKSKEEKIRMIFTQYGMGPDSCVFVTDTLGDIREAAKLGVGAIGVTWGFHEPERLLRGSPFRLIEKPEDLPAAVSDYFARGGKN